MDVSFERGDPQQPKGHALVYFRTRSEPDKVYASYIIILPIAVDFAKYVPPFLASSLGSMPLGDLSAFSLPPMPEEVGSHEELQRLADIRGDDLLYAGTMQSHDLPEMMEAVSDVVRQYSQAWSDAVKPALAAETTIEDSSLRVNEVLFGFMSEQDKLAELSKLVGSLRFAVEGTDRQTQAEVQEEIDILSRHLPVDYYIPSLIEAVLDSSVKGGQLAQLYLDRCYKLSNGDIEDARNLETRIETLRASG